MAFTDGKRMIRNVLFNYLQSIAFWDLKEGETQIWVLNVVELAVGVSRQVISHY